MDPNRFANRCSVAVALTGMVLVLLILGVFRFKQQERMKVVEQLTERQARLTVQAAAHITHHLQRLQQGLSHLAAEGSGLLRDSRAAEAKLDFLADNYPGQLLTILYIKDREGNIPAEFPPGKLVSAPFPVHLLPDNPPLFAPLLFTVATEPFLLLGQPIMEGKIRRGELVAVISLEGLRDYCLGSLQDQPGTCLLLDESGVFLLHPDPRMIGRSFAEVTAADRQPELFRILSAMHKGERGTGRYRDLFLNTDPSAVELAPEHLLTYTPLRVPGARWSLATALPSSILTAIDRNDAGFRLVFSLGLILASILTVPAARFILNFRTLAAERDRYRDENNRLLRDLGLAERRYHHLFDNAGDAIFFIEPHTGALQEINRQMEELLGYSAEEIRTLSLTVLFPGWQRRRYLRLVKRVLKDGYGEEYNLLFRRKDGQLFAGAVHARLGDLGSAQVVHGTVRDVTEHKRIEQELRQRNRDLTLINEIAHRAAGSRNLKEMLQAVLAQVIQTFGVDGGGIYLVEEEKENLELAAHREIKDELLRDLRRIPSGIGLVGRVAASGQPRTSADLRKDHRVRSGHVLEAGWRGFQAIPLASNEKTVGVLFLFCYGKRTLTREEVKLLLAIGKQVGTSVEGARLFEALQWQHRLTQASNRELEFSRQQLKKNLAWVEESNRLLEQLERMKSNFLALASHELRTPLTYILPSTEFLSQRLDERLDADEKRFLEAIELGGKRLNEIVNDLLEVARLESKNLYLGQESINLPSLVREVGADFLPVLKERELTFSIGEFPEHLLFFGDPDHLRKAVRRLVENAVKFTPRGGGIEIEAVQRTPAEVLAMEPTVSPFSPSFFRKDFSDPFLQMTVRDTGIGINPEEQLRIFDKFYEVGDFDSHFTSQTSFGGKGVGLGLTLVRGMVEAHGGMVWVESQGTTNGGRGSSFHVLLPLTTSAEEGSHATD